MDFAAPSRKEQHIEMLMAMEKALFQSKCIVQPVCYILPEVDKGVIGNSLLKAITISSINLHHRQTERDHEETSGSSC